MKKARIFHVDDEVGAARLLKMNLEATGRYEVRVQNWPEEALAAARAFQPDLILLDLVMPRMSGGSVVELFEHDPGLKDVPIAFFTASVRRERVREHDGLSRNHPCLAKPARLDEIAAFIDANLPEAVRAGLPGIPPPAASQGTNTSRPRP